METDKFDADGQREEVRDGNEHLDEEHGSQGIFSPGAAVEVGGEQKALGSQIPPDFRCPLSLELMSDPVIVASGQTYERVYIQQWLDQGNTTCPKTRQILTHTNLIPNYTVKALIASWCEANNVPLPEPSKIDRLNAIFKLSSVPCLKTELEERRVESTSRPVQEHSLSVKPRHQERSMSGGGSHPLGRSRRTLLHTSVDEREVEGIACPEGGEEQGGAQPESRYPTTYQLDGDASLRRISLVKEKGKSDGASVYEPSSPSNDVRASSGISAVSSLDNGQGSSVVHYRVAGDTNHTLGSPPYESDVSGEVERLSIASTVAFADEAGLPSRPQDRTAGSPWRRLGDERDTALPTIVLSPLQDTLENHGSAQVMVAGLVIDLESDDVDVQRQAAAKLRLLAKYNMENRILIANSGAIKPLVALLNSADPRTQENAVTALLNLSINDNNKSEIAAAGAIDPLVHVLKVGNVQAMENAAATLFSLSVMDDNKVTIGASGAIPPLVHLLINGTPRGKKDAATALFNLSIFHENKARIVRAGAIKPLVELMADPAAGMVDKAVAVLANLATIPEGRVAIGEEGGIPALVEVVEAGSQRGKENAAAALLQLCMNSHKHRALVLQEGAIPPLVALSQSGTARAKEKASALLRHFREQRHQVLGPRPGPDKHLMGQYYV
ncbi:unnamed protein product [Calypogeia fissa]